MYGRVSLCDCLYVCVNPNIDIFAYFSNISQKFR